MLFDARCVVAVIEGLFPLSVAGRAADELLGRSIELARHGDASQSGHRSGIGSTQRIAVLMRSWHRAQRSRARDVNTVSARLANDTVHFDPRRLFQRTALSSVIGSLTGRRLGPQRLALFGDGDARPPFGLLWPGRPRDITWRRLSLRP